MRIASANPDVVRIAPNATTPGTAFIDVEGPDGSTRVDFFVQGVRGATGDGITVTASSPQFVDGTVDVDVIAPGLQVVGLSTNTNTLAADDAFWVTFRIPHPTSGGLSQTQAVSPEARLAGIHIARIETAASRRTTGTRLALSNQATP